MHVGDAFHTGTSSPLKRCSTVPPPEGFAEVLEAMAMTYWWVLDRAGGEGGGHFNTLCALSVLYVRVHVLALVVVRCSAHWRHLNACF